MKTIVFIVPVLSQPRCIKRIETLHNAGYQIKVYGFDRGQYSNNITNIKCPIKEVIKLPEGNKYKSFIFQIKCIGRIIRENNKKDCIFYFFGFETTRWAYYLGCRNYIYECADVSSVKKKNPIFRKFLVGLDKKLVYMSKLSVFTSQGFIDYLFPNEKLDNVILLPNKLKQYFNNEMRSSVVTKVLNIEHIKFGFVGGARYRNTLGRFAHVIGVHFPQHEFHFYGDICDRAMLHDFDNYPNVICHGSFSNPKDLQSIYENLDVIVATYDTQSINVLIAEPNKLYESIFFYKPLLVSKGTFVEKRVKQMNVGDGIDASNDEAIINYINNITENTFIDNIISTRQVKTEELIDSPNELIIRISNLIK